MDFGQLKKLQERAHMCGLGKLSMRELREHAAALRGAVDFHRAGLEAAGKELEQTEKEIQWRHGCNTFCRR